MGTSNVDSERSWLSSSKKASRSDSRSLTSPVKTAPSLVKRHSLASIARFAVSMPSLPMWMSSHFRDEIQTRPCAWMRRATSTKSMETLARRSCSVGRTELRHSLGSIANSVGNLLDTVPSLQLRQANGHISTTTPWSLHRAVLWLSTRFEMWELQLQLAQIER